MHDWIAESLSGVWAGQVPSLATLAVGDVLQHVDVSAAAWVALWGCLAAEPTPEELGGLLSIAAARGRAGTVRWLLGLGVVDVNRRDPRTLRTPLHDAAMGGHADAVQALAEAGADVEALNHIRLTPLLLALSSRNSADCVGRLLAAGADPHARGLQRATALHYACRADALPAVRLLLAAGADVHATDNFGDTAGFCASRDAVSVELLAALAEHGWDVLSTGAMGRTVLHRLAAFGGDLDGLLELVRARNRNMT
jgi:hypothetical protein